MSNFKRICVVRLSAIGDTCHALAVIRRLQDNWPDVRITWIIGKVEAMLMGDIKDIDFIIFDKAKGRAAYADVKRALDGQSFDVALCMHASMRANFLCRTIDSPIRLGFDRRRAKDFQWLFTNQRIASAERAHALDAMMSFATSVGAEPRPIRWDIPIDPDSRQFAKDYKSPNMPLVVISPCSSQRARNFRNWRVENYARVIAELQRRRCRILLTGGTSALESQYGDRLSQNGAADNLIGKTNLKQLAALLEQADLVICPDSGPAHIATAMSTPVLGLYATSNPERTGPYISRELTVNRYPDAAQQFLGKPAHRLRFGQRVRSPDAMELISVADVNEKLQNFFDV